MAAAFPDDEDFDPDKGFAKKVVSDKWDDEDIDDAKVTF